MSNSDQSLYIPILCDVHDAQELQSIFQSSSTQLSFELKEDQKIVTRSALSDPIVLSAIISAGAVITASLIGLIGTIWVTRMNNKKASEDASIVIKISGDAVTSLLQKNDRKAQLQELFNNSNTIELTPQEASNIEATDNPYHSIFSTLAPEEVEHIAIIEDQ